VFETAEDADVQFDVVNSRRGLDYVTELRNRVDP